MEIHNFRGLLPPAARPDLPAELRIINETERLQKIEERRKRREQRDAFWGKLKERVVGNRDRGPPVQEGQEREPCEMCEAS